MLSLRGKCAAAFPAIPVAVAPRALDREALHSRQRLATGLAIFHSNFGLLYPEISDLSPATSGAAIAKRKVNR